MAMCRGSVNALTTEDAKHGVDYQISKTAHLGGNYAHGVLHRPGKGQQRVHDARGEFQIACAACIREATAVVLAKVPDFLQKRFDIGATSPAVFLSGDDM